MDKHEAKAGQGWNETNSKSKRVCKLPRSDVGGAMSPGPRTAPQPPATLRNGVGIFV